MVLAVASYKGGVAKTTTAVHLAAALARRHESTALIDGDPNRSATRWCRRSETQFPFEILDMRDHDTMRRIKEFQNVVLDTEARPSTSDLVMLSNRADLLVIPAIPDAISLDATIMMTGVLPVKTNARILLTVVPPRGGSAIEAQAELHLRSIPCFRHWIPRLAAFPKAHLAGCLVRDVSDPRAEIGWKAYCQVLQEIR